MLQSVVAAVVYIRVALAISFYTELLVDDFLFQNRLETRKRCCC